MSAATFEDEMKPQTTNQNPLHARPLTVEEYSQLSRAGQVKAGWLLKDHVAEIDVKIEAARAELEVRMQASRKVYITARNKLARRDQTIASMDARIAKAEAEIAADNTRAQERLSVLRTERAKLRQKLRWTEKRHEEVTAKLSKALTEAEDAEAALAAARTRRAAAENAEEREAREERVRQQAEARLRRLRSADVGELDEGERNLMDLDAELSSLDRHRVRKAKAAEAALTAAEALTG